MAFPLTPTNGQLFQTGGITYIYNSTYGVWTRVADVSADTANASFLRANASYTAQNTTAVFANSAYTHANAAYAAANTGGGGGSDTWARAQANAAFSKANSSVLIWGITDETTNVTVSSARSSFRAPSAMSITSIPRATLNVASTSGIVTCDIKLNGTSILGANKLTIDATEKTSTTAVTATTLVTTAVSDGTDAALMAIDYLNKG